MDVRSLPTPSKTTYGEYLLVTDPPRQKKGIHQGRPPRRFRKRRRILRRLAKKTPQCPNGRSQRNGVNLRSDRLPLRDLAIPLAIAIIGFRFRLEPHFS